MLDLYDMQLWMYCMAIPVGGFCVTLVYHPTSNWLSANLVAHIHCLLEVLAPLNYQLWVSGCPWCQHTAG